MLKQEQTDFLDAALSTLPPVPVQQVQLPMQPVPLPLPASLPVVLHVVQQGESHGNLPPLGGLGVLVGAPVSSLGGATDDVGSVASGSSSNSSNNNNSNNNINNSNSINNSSSSSSSSRPAAAAAASNNNKREAVRDPAAAPRAKRGRKKKEEVPEETVALIGGVSSRGRERKPKSFAFADEQAQFAYSLNASNSQRYQRRIKGDAYDDSEVIYFSKDNNGGVAAAPGAEGLGGSGAAGAAPGAGGEDDDDEEEDVGGLGDGDGLGNLQAAAPPLPAAITVEANHAAAHPLAGMGGASLEEEDDDDDDDGLR